MFPVNTERHAMPRGDPFADVGVIILVEFDQINFLTLGSMLPENVEPFHWDITG